MPNLLNCTLFQSSNLWDKVYFFPDNLKTNAFKAFLKAIDHHHEVSHDSDVTRIWSFRLTPYHLYFGDGGETSQLCQNLPQITLKPFTSRKSRLKVERGGEGYIFGVWIGVWVFGVKD